MIRRRLPEVDPAYPFVVSPGAEIMESGLCLVNRILGLG
jgi:hypothetical protein